MGSEEWVPAGIDEERPSSARVYDYYLGGAHNFAVDRQLAERMIAAYPEVPYTARENRAFLRRSVEFLVDAGVRQFLDIGSGIPTVGHVHEIAQTKAPESRVVFVDVDPVAVEHSRLILAGNDRTAVVEQDVRRPEQILDAPQVRDLFDLDQPVAVLMVALFHFISDADDPAGLVSRLATRLASGSYVAISHLTGDALDETAGGLEIYRRGGIDITMRSRPQFEALFGGLELVDPGVVWVPQWHPDWPADVGDAPETSSFYAGVARKP
jgi:hypothetical protein